MTFTPKLGIIAMISLVAISSFSLVAAEDPIDGPEEHTPPLDQISQVGYDTALVRDLVRMDLSRLADGTWAVIATHPSPYSGAGQEVTDATGALVNRQVLSGTYRVLATISGPDPKMQDSPYHWVVWDEPSDDHRSDKKGTITNLVLAREGTALAQLDENANGSLRFKTIIRIPNEWANQVKPAMVALKEPTKRDLKMLQDQVRLSTNPFLVFAAEKDLASLDPKVAAEYALMPPGACDQPWVTATLIACVAPATAAANDDLKARWNELVKVIGKESIDKKAYELAIGLQAATPLTRTNMPLLTWCDDQILSLTKISQAITLDSSSFASILLPVLRYHYGWRIKSRMSRDRER